MSRRAPCQMGGGSCCSHCAGTPPRPSFRLLQGKGKKKLTCVRGIEAFGVDAAAAAKMFGKKFACGSALQKGKNGQPDQIEVQGSYVEVRHCTSR